MTPVLTASHMEGFVADQRHRAEHGLPMLRRRLTKNGAPGIVTKCIQSATFNGARRVLRFGLDSGDAERLGLDRRFALALPGGDMRTGRRRPFPDVLARAVANQQNLERLEESDEDDRGIRDIWETQVLTGRRGKEVREVRLDCISRLNGVPLFWHDQTKVGNLERRFGFPSGYTFALSNARKRQSTDTFRGLATPQHHKNEARSHYFRAEQVTGNYSRASATSGSSSCSARGWRHST
ncbi:hypothetical protein ACWGUP_20310 [Streptomyces diastaticus]|uniref:Uncharacterized protein n=2 Tax=Streptomyces TaxID=1883 RepID=A0A8H9LSH9_9ACTN|nr:hypothetical protein Sgou_05230 [Streptomyces gougerotii]GGU91796.1 hypothetical protein GCM10010227_53920 [Streptomyces gougerotii]